MKNRGNGQNGPGTVRVAVVEVGNCASSLIQGVHNYRDAAPDSPNSAGIVIDAVRCCELALDHGLSGSREGPSACFMKSPARQYTDSDARRLTEEFITRYGRGSAEPSEQRAAAAQD